MINTNIEYYIVSSNNNHTNRTSNNVNNVKDNAQLQICTESLEQCRYFENENGWLKGAKF